MKCEQTGRKHFTQGRLLGLAPALLPQKPPQLPVTPHWFLKQTLCIQSPDWGRAAGVQTCGPTHEHGGLELLGLRWTPWGFVDSLMLQNDRNKSESVPITSQMCQFQLPGRLSDEKTVPVRLNDYVENHLGNTEAQPKLKSIYPP